MKKLRLFITVFIFVLTSVLVMNNSFALDDGEIAVKEEKKKQLEGEISAIQEKREEVNKHLNETKTRKKSKLEVKRNIDKQVGNTKQEIVSLSQKITYCNRNICQAQNNIEQKEKEISDKIDLFKERIKAGYTTPKVTQLEAMVNTEKFSEFLCSTEYETKIAKYDKGCIEDLNNQLVYIQKEKEKIEYNKLQIEHAKVGMEEKKKVLDVQAKGVTQEVFSIEKEEQAYLKDAENLKRQMIALQAEIERLCKEMSDDNSPFVGGEFIWPVPGHYKISSPYGPRSFDGFHTGVDIAGGGIYGKNIVAMNDGVVKFVNTNSRGSLYGKYLIIDHGGGYASLYAHASSICVSYGQNVKKGETIAAVGSTGNSTGPHAHIEIRINGKHTNPMKFFH